MKFAKRTISNSPNLPSVLRIKSFWKWFSSNADTLASLLEQDRVDELARMLGPSLKSLDQRVGWELGPGTSERCAFSISLNGALINVPIAQAIADGAPKKLKGWEISIGRPPKSWDGRFELRNELGQVVSLDAAKWSYVLDAFQDRAFFDITIIAEWPRMDALSKKQAARTAIQNVVGERRMLEKFDRIEVAENITAELTERYSAFLNLKSHLDYLAEGRTER